MDGGRRWNETAGASGNGFAMDEGADSWAVGSQDHQGIVGSVDLGNFTVRELENHGNQWEKVPLTARQIRKLFDDVAKDSGSAEGPLLCDPDLADLNDESWKKAIQRRRKGWVDGIPWGVDKSLLH